MTVPWGTRPHVGLPLGDGGDELGTLVLGGRGCWAGLTRNEVGGVAGVPKHASAHAMVPAGHAKEALSLAQMQEQTLQLEQQAKLKVRGWCWQR